MKKLSIKNRMALWYAFSILAIILLTMALLLAVGDSLILDETEKNLMSLTDRAVRDVRITDGTLSIDEDITYYNDGAYVVICRDDGTVISGLLMEGFPPLTDFSENEIRKVPGDGRKYYTYDRLIENRKTGKIWVRGMTSAELSDMAPSAMKMLYGFLVALPVLFILAMAGGWMITRQAFAPLSKIIDTAESIRQGGDLSGRIGLGDIHDSDEIRRTAAVFDEMLDQIENDFENEKRFTNNASHELRTPVAVIKAQSEYALDNPDDPAEIRESLQEIKKQADSMSSLIEQLLRLSRADRGIEQLTKGPADISLIAEEAASRHLQYARTKNITIRTDAEEGCYMQCDAVFIGRMFDNLIDNAVKYGTEGGTVDIIVRKEDAGIAVKVADNGIGIAEKDLDHIWERFYRADRERRTDSAGEDARSMGLGLPMVKWIVREHGGTVKAVSALGKGTAFIIIFPY
ncbi:MAG: HAMP domain-containing histidine kinase [Lachnospiraceae bacterium]|nr:HAMP domain-containing histidine kinase [Lachnospiraceae bacterium]